LELGFEPQGTIKGSSDARGFSAMYPGLINKFLLKCSLDLGCQELTAFLFMIFKDEYGNNTLTKTKARAKKSMKNKILQLAK
jgi:hypothetical protein